MRRWAPQHKTPLVHPVYLTHVYFLTKDGDIVEASPALKYPGSRERLVGQFLPTLQVR